MRQVLSPSRLGWEHGLPLGTEGRGAGEGKEEASDMGMVEGAGGDRAWEMDLGQPGGSGHEGEFLITGFRPESVWW